MLAVMGTIFFLSHQPGETLLLPDVPDIDKLLHSLAYGVLAATTLYAVSKSSTGRYPGRTGALVIGFCLAYGLSDEFHQSFIPGRLPSFWDVGADLLGAVVVVSIWLYLKKKSSFRVSDLKFPACGS